MRYLYAVLAASAMLAAMPVVALADGDIALASRLPSLSTVTTNTDSRTDIFTGERASKSSYNLQLLGVTSLVAADDGGIHTTMVAKPGSQYYKASSDVTKLGDLTYVAPILGAVYLTGGDTNHRLAEHAAIAVWKAGAIGVLAKYVVGRERPGDVQDAGRGTTFSPFSPNDVYNSFPSGHSLVAFSVATVWAHEKPSERYLAYGLASLVGLSRIALGAHWASDVLVGAALGVAQGRQVNNGNTDLLSFKF